MDRAKSLEIPTPFYAEFQRRGDVSAYAAAYTGFLRAVSEPVLWAALNQPMRRGATVECLYERIRERLVADPERYAWRIIHVGALLTRCRKWPAAHLTSSGSRRSPDPVQH